MGVKIGDLIPRKKVNFEDLSNKRIAIDASNMLYQFLSSIRQQDGTLLMDKKGRVTSHLMGTLTRLTNLMNKGVKISVVFDGKMPILKIKEQENREYRKNIAAGKMQQALEEEDYDEAYKYSKQTSRLTKEMCDEAKKLIDYLGLPVIQAAGEADAQAAFMCKNNDVDYVASSDMDCLVFGAPYLVTNLTLSMKRKLPSGEVIYIRPDLISLKEVLSSLEINQDQLIVMSILIGTDYNVGGVKNIGPKKALNLVKKYNDYDKMFKELNVEFDWKDVFDVYKKHDVTKNYNLEWKEINKEKVIKFLVDEHDFSLERVEKLVSKETTKSKNEGLNKWFK
ncbi:flap endonuclease-1 [Candidatus Woesearchaeota archaeon]|nr:flap endonuclease-1 [Candidatus Woesearchaeota archaeon]